MDKNGPPKTINERAGIYSVDSGTLSKRFTVDVTEVDGERWDRDDIGPSTVTFELGPDTAATTKFAVIDLKQHNLKKYNGKVKAGLSAQLV